MQMNGWQRMNTNGRARTQTQLPGLFIIGRHEPLWAPLIDST